MRCLSTLLLAAMAVVSLATLHAQDESAATVLVQLNQVSVVDSSGYFSRSPWATGCASTRP